MVVILVSVEGRDDWFIINILWIFNDEWLLMMIYINDDYSIDAIICEEMLMVIICEDVLINNDD